MLITLQEVKDQDPCGTGWRELKELVRADKTVPNWKEQKFDLGVVARKCSDWDDVEWVLDEVIPQWKLMYFNLMLFEKFYPKESIPENYRPFATEVIVTLWNMVYRKTGNTYISKLYYKNRELFYNELKEEETSAIYHPLRKLIDNSECFAEYIMDVHQVPMREVTNLLSWID